MPHNSLINDDCVNWSQLKDAQFTPCARSRKNAQRVGFDYNHHGIRNLNHQFLTNSKQIISYEFKQYFAYFISESLILRHNIFRSNMRDIGKERLKKKKDSDESTLPLAPMTLPVTGLDQQGAKCRCTQRKCVQGTMPSRNFHGQPPITVY